MELLEQYEAACKVRRLAPRTIQTYRRWVEEFLRFHQDRTGRWIHPNNMGEAESAYGGLVPRQYQSGELDRRGRITKRGPAVLRKLLVQAAWAMLRYNAWARAVYERLSRGKARKKQAVVALARRLLVRCWAMLRDGAPWREPGPPAAAPA